MELRLPKTVGAGPKLSHPADVGVSHLLKPILLPLRGFPADRGGSSENRHAPWNWLNLPGVNYLERPFKIVDAGQFSLWAYATD